MRIHAEDLARVIASGLAAAFLTGMLTLLWSVPEPLPGPTQIWAVVVIGLISAVGYRHVGALATAGSVLTLLGVAQLYAGYLGQRGVAEEAQLGRGDLDHLFQGPAFSVLLGCLLLGAAFGWALRRAAEDSRRAQYGAGRIVGALVLGVLAFWPLSAAMALEAYDDGTVQLMRVVISMVVGLLVGVLPALSPVGAVPAAVGLGVIVARSEDGDLFAASMVAVLATVLATAVHFLGPVDGPDEPGPDAGAPGSDTAPRGRSVD